MLLCLLPFATYSILCQIPNEYLNLVNEAKQNAQAQLLSSRQNIKSNILNPGYYSINNFKFKLNSPVTGKGANGLFGFALNRTENVIAIISKRKHNISDIHTTKNTVFATSVNDKLVKLGDKIADDGEVSIIKYKEIDPFSIFSDFHFSNSLPFSSREISFSDIYEFLKSYLGNDIYKQYALKQKCGTDKNSSQICRGFFNYNWPEVTKNTDISNQNPLHNETYFSDSEGNKKIFESDIGGVFGQFTGLSISFQKPSDLKLTIFQGTEAETNVRFDLPAGKYENQNISIGEKKYQIFQYGFKIFDIGYSINVDGISSINIRNLNFSANEKLNFNQRAGFKAQKEFIINNYESPQTPYKMNYELLQTDIDPPEKHFKGEKLEMIIDTYTGIEITLKSQIGLIKQNFSVNCGITYSRKIEAKENSVVCPSPYLLGTNTDMLYFNLETLNPFKYGNLIIVPKKRFIDNNLYWIGKESSPWCLGGNLYSFDSDQEIGIKNSAALIIKSVQLGTEYPDKSQSDYIITVKIFIKDRYNPSKIINTPRFKFPNDSNEINLNYFAFVNDYSNNIQAVFSCTDSKETIYENDNYFDVSNNFNSLITLTSSKGNPIMVHIISGPSVNCHFGKETIVDKSCNFASVVPNMIYGNTIGLITHQSGSPYSCFTTFINDEYSKGNQIDCIYKIKNIWKIEFVDINIDFEYQSISLSIEIYNGNKLQTILSKEIKKANKKNIQTINCTFEVPKLDTTVKMNIDIHTTSIQIKQSNIIATKFFFEFNDHTIHITSENEYRWDCSFNLVPYHYPIIFDIDTLQDTSLIFAPAYKSIQPFSQDIDHDSPSTIRVECPHINENINQYGIFKLEFELDFDSFSKVDIEDIDVLLIMKNIRPICKYKKIGEDTYLIKMAKFQITLMQSDGKHIGYYPIPFRRNSESQLIIPYIQIVDIFLPPTNDVESCNSEMQFFKASYPFIHNACIVNTKFGKMTGSTFASHIHSFDCDVKTTQYSYPPNNNLVAEWKLLGFSMSVNDKDDLIVPHDVLLRQKEIQFPIEKSSYFISKDITKYFSEDNNPYIIICPRCNAMKLTPDNEFEKTIYPNNDNEFVLNVSKNKEYLLLAVCKGKRDNYCETKLDKLEKNNLTLLSIPSNALVIKDEFDYRFGQDGFYFNNDIQFTYNRDNITYITSSRSKIQNICTFKFPLSIKVIAKVIGKYIRISAFEVNTNCILPFSSQNEDIINHLSIKSNDNNIDLQIIRGSVYLFNNTTVSPISSIPIINGPKLFGIEDNLQSKFRSISVDYSLICSTANFEDNFFCFVQSNENLCQNIKALPIRYPEFNEFVSFMDKNNNSIHIIINEDINYFFPKLKDIPYSDQDSKTIPDNLNITFECLKKVKITGEFMITSRIIINFIGEFDLSDLYITTNVDWDLKSAGIMSFTKTKQYPHIDVNIEKDPISANIIHDALTLVISGNPSLNLLKKYDLNNEFEYTIVDKTIYCESHNETFNLQNEFCVYKYRRDLCSCFNNSMESITNENLNHFPNFFNGIYDNKITLHLVENMTFTKETLQTFFENHPYTSFLITSDKNKISLYGVIKCPKYIKLSFDDDDYLDIKNLEIEKSVSINSRLNAIGINSNINLNHKQVKYIKIDPIDMPSYYLSDSIDFLLIENCDFDDFSYLFENETYQTDYLNITFDLEFKKDNIYVKMSTSFIYDDNNIFCIYENDICGIETGRPIKSNQISTIFNYIDTINYDNITLIISQDVNINLDISRLTNDEINYVYIKGSFNSVKLSGEIKIHEGVNAILSNLSIDNLMLNIDFHLSELISSYFDIVECSGNPTIKTFPHLLPTDFYKWKNNVTIFPVLKTNIDFVFDFTSRKFPMNGGYIVQDLAIQIENSSKTYSMNFTYHEITVEPNAQYHFCIYQNNESSCPKEIKPIDYTKFCAFNFQETVQYAETIFYVAENIKLMDSCNFEFEDKINRQILIYGNHSMNGNISIAGNADIIVFNKKIINNLNVTLKVLLSHNQNSLKINVPSIMTFEGGNPKTLNINISSYSKEIEMIEITESSRPFLQGICFETQNNIPIPYTRDFRIRPICTNTNGINEMKIKCLIQDYNSNQFCFYDKSLSKCIFNASLEKHLPVKYSDVYPSFVKGGNELSIYFFDSPKSEFQFSFQIAYLLGYNEATLLNNDNAKISIFAPYSFNLNGLLSNVKLYFQFNFNNNNKIKFGKIQSLSKNIQFHPVSHSHNSFIHYNDFDLCDEKIFTSNLFQNYVFQSKISQNTNGIQVNTIQNKFNYEISNKPESNHFYNFYDDFYIYIYSIHLITSETLNPYLLRAKKLAIQSTKDNVLTLDIEKKDNSHESKELFISDVRINFTNEGDIDFGDYHVIFIKCQLDSNWVNRVTGNNLLFDNESYYSFYNNSNKIYAFEGDYIQVTQSSVSLQKDLYKIKGIPLIKLNSYNSFVDKFGKTINFTGTNSILTIESVMPNTNLIFYNFTNLSIITETMDQYLSLVNVEKCILHLAKESVPNYIQKIEISKSIQTEIRSNGKIILNQLILSSNYNAFSIPEIIETISTENNNIAIKNANFSESIYIQNESYLTIKSSKTLKKINIYIESENFINPQMILDSDNDIQIDYLYANFIGSNITSSGNLISGLSNSDCNSLVNRTFVFFNLKNETNKFDFYCENGANSDNIISFKLHIEPTQKKPSKKLSPGAIAGIVVGSAVAIIIVACAIICFVIKCKNANDNNNHNNNENNAYTGENLLFGGLKTV